MFLRGGVLRIRLGFDYWLEFVVFVLYVFEGIMVRYVGDEVGVRI